MNDPTPYIASHLPSCRTLPFGCEIFYGQGLLQKRQPGRSCSAFLPSSSSLATSKRSFFGLARLILFSRGTTDEAAAPAAAGLSRVARLRRLTVLVIFRAVDDDPVQHPSQALQICTGAFAHRPVHLTLGQLQLSQMGQCHPQPIVQEIHNLCHLFLVGAQSFAVVESHERLLGLPGGEDCRRDLLQKKCQQKLQPHQPPHWSSAFPRHTGWRYQNFAKRLRRHQVRQGLPVFLQRPFYVCH